MSPKASALGTSLPHESGHLHVSGEARYVDDLPPPRGMLVAQALTSNVAHGFIRRLDVRRARVLPGVHAVLTAEDIPGHNDISPFARDEELLASSEVHCIGQSIALVVAESLELCRAGIARIDLEIEARPALLSIEAARAAGSFLSNEHVIERGHLETAFAGAKLRLEGTVETGGQDHFYLETHASLVTPLEDRSFLVQSSTQHPSEVQAKVAEVLGLSSSAVVVECPRMGGGFGGKETQAANFAALAALGAHHTRRPVKVWLNRDQDMICTGKRHPFWSRFRAGFEADGRITALEVETYSDGGFSADLSKPVLDRALFHLDNAYFIPNLRFSGRVVRTHQPSNTAFRGFGGPQGMFVVEHVLNLAAERLGLDSAEIRERNFYGPAPRNLTPYGQEVTENRLARIHSELLESAEYRARQASIAAHNQSHRWKKRGLAFQPVKFGISFTNAMLNQAGALVNIFIDGSVQVNHGGTEMGQGLHTKMRVIAAHELGLPLSRIRLMTTATDKIPNTSATAASSGADLNGQAVRQACVTLRERLAPVACGLLEIPDTERAGVIFEDGQVRHPASKMTVDFSALTVRAHRDQVSLSATGYYRTPNIHYDEAQGRGHPFHYFAYGGAVIEVEVNGFTGEHRLRRVDVLHDVGDSLVPSVDRGQIEGGFIQGLGWLTSEELVVAESGELRTHSPDTYKIPALGEAPPDFFVHLLERAPQPDVVHGSKAVGEPPFMLAIGVITALRQAILAYGSGAAELSLEIPATPEAVLRAIESRREPR